MYLLRLGLRPWRIAPASQLVSAVAVGFLLCICGLLFWLHAGLQPLIARLQSEQVITAYLAADGDERDRSRTIDSIRVSLGAQAEVRMVEPSQFIGSLKPQFPELARELEGLGDEAGTVVPRFLTISGTLPSSSLEKVRSTRGIESAESSKDRFRHVIGAFDALRWVSRLVMGGLALALFCGLVQLARTNAHLTSDALSLLRLWGVAELPLRAPSILAGSTVGFVGGIIGVGGWMFWGGWLIRHVRALSPGLESLPASSGAVPPMILVAGIALGAAAGLLGASPPGSAEPAGR
jgi:cell division protein FtsX